METGAVKLSIEYDSELWTLNVEVLEAEIIPLDESKEKEGNWQDISYFHTHSFYEKVSNHHSTLQFANFTTETTFEFP